MAENGTECLRGQSGGAHLLRRGKAMTDDKESGTPAAPGGAVGAKPKAETSHVLLVEDDETLANLLARVLRNEGFHVDVVDNADSLPTGEKLDRYDVVLSDIHLANETSGHDVLRRIHTTNPATPVILMTAYADIEGAMNAVGEGAYDYLAKPIEPTELKRMVGEAIARRKLAQAGGDERPAKGAPPVAQIVGTTPT